jgi:LAS superfamily LD-carboxypeptidase LdcB
MNKVFLLPILLVTTGCAMAPRMPTDVSLMPDDCANRQAIIRWLESTAAAPRHSLERQEDYEKSQSAIKARIWRIRYNCQRV